MLMKTIELETSAGIYKHYDIVSYILNTTGLLDRSLYTIPHKNQKKMKHLMVFSLNISYQQF